MMKISVQKGPNLVVSMTNEERQRLFPTSPHVRFTRDGESFWLEGTAASVGKHTDVRNIIKQHDSGMFQVIIPPAVHHYQFSGLHLPTVVQIETENASQRALIEVPQAFFHDAGRPPQQRKKTSTSGALATDELAAAERAIRLLNGLVDRERIELILREGRVRAVARITLGG